MCIKTTFPTSFLISLSTFHSHSQSLALERVRRVRLNTDKRIYSYAHTNSHAKSKQRSATCVCACVGSRRRRRRRRSRLWLLLLLLVLLAFVVVVTVGHEGESWAFSLPSFAYYDAFEQLVAPDNGWPSSSRGSTRATSMCRRRLASGPHAGVHRSGSWRRLDVLFLSRAVFSNWDFRRSTRTLLERDGARTRVGWSSSYSVFNRFVMVLRGRAEVELRRGPRPGAAAAAASSLARSRFGSLYKPMGGTCTYR